MVEVVAVFGLSGVGKSWLISRFVRQHAFVHVQASQLLRDAKSASTGVDVTSEELRTGTVLDNQALLIRAFRARCAAETTPIIFDGHCVIDSSDELIEIPVSVIGALRPSGLIFIADDPKLIVARRSADQTRERPSRTTDELTSHQHRALDLFAIYAQHLGLKPMVVNAGDEVAFASAILAIIPCRSY